MLSRTLAVVLVAGLIVETSGDADGCFKCGFASPVGAESRVSAHQGAKLYAQNARLCTHERIRVLRLRGGASYDTFPGDSEAADEALDELYQNVKKVCSTRMASGTLCALSMILTRKCLTQIRPCHMQGADLLREMDESRPKVLGIGFVPPMFSRE
jgi:hypothetical protein